MIPDAYLPLFILVAAYHETDDKPRVIADIQAEIENLKAQGINTLPAYVTEILEALTP